MRAKASVVVFVMFGLLGAVGSTASAAERVQAAPQVQDRGHRDGDHHGHDGKGWCVAEEETVVGPVCVNVEDVLTDILST